MLHDNDAPVRVVCAGADATRAAVLSRELVAEGAGALLSFGIAGGLAPDIESGELILAERVCGSGLEDYACDARWRAAVAARLSEAMVAHRGGAILGGARVLRSVADKDSAYRESACLAVDMESAAVAAIAAEAGLPFLAVRAVADRASDTLPSLVESAVKPDGRANVGRAVAVLLRHPSEIPATLRLARQTELALARLRMLEAVKSALLGGF
jgi:adenosylhomocysteine nucleosidase